MKDLRFFRSVCRWGNILFSILRVFSVIGAVGLLIGIMFCSLAPAELFQMDVTADTQVSFSLRSILGDQWEEARDAAELPAGAEWTEDGFSVRETVPTVSVSNRLIALMLVPSFVEMILSYALYLFLCRVFRTLADSHEPLRACISRHLRNAGWLLMALGTIPALCGNLVGLLTGQQDMIQVELDLFMVFLGFVLWAVADLFLYAAGRLNVMEAAISRATAAQTPPAAPAEAPAPEAPAADEKKDDSDFHPDAF